MTQCSQARVFIKYTLQRVSGFLKTEAITMCYNRNHDDCSVVARKVLKRQMKALQWNAKRQNKKKEKDRKEKCKSKEKKAKALAVQPGGLIKLKNVWQSLIFVAPRRVLPSPYSPPSLLTLWISALIVCWLVDLSLAPWQVFHHDWRQLLVNYCWKKGNGGSRKWAQSCIS